MFSSIWAHNRTRFNKILSYFKKPSAPLAPHDALAANVVSTQNDIIKAALHNILIPDILNIIYVYYGDDDNALLYMLRESIISNDKSGIHNALRLGANLSQHYEEMTLLAGANSNIKSLLTKQIGANAGLNQAIANGLPIKIIDVLENEGAQVSVKIPKSDGGGGYYYLIHWCVMHPHRGSLLKPCIDAGADVCSRDSDGLEPLHLAAQLGKSDVAQFLIDQKACVSAKTSVGLEPLHLASRGGHLPTILCLVNAGADPQAKATGESDMQPMHIAALYGKPAIVEYFISIGVPESAQTALGNQVTHIAARMDNVGLLKCCLDRGADPSAANSRGMQPLHYAAKYGSTAVVKYLLDEQADVSAQDINGKTPIDLARMQENPNDDVLSLLMAAQALLDGQAHDQPRNLDTLVLGDANAEVYE